MSLPIHFLDAGQDILAAGNSLLHFSRPLIVIKKEAEIPLLLSIIYFQIKAIPLF